MHTRICFFLSLILAACGGGGGGGSASNTQSSGATSSTAPASSSSSASSTTASNVTGCSTPTGRVLEVGPGKTYATPSAAATVALDGDTVRIAAGNYNGDVATWTRANLTICGVGGQAHVYANGNSAGGKAIWVAAGNNMVVENIVFHDAAVADQNGAGIRIEPNVNITIRGCGFLDSENGILGGSGTSNIVIERSEFARNGRGDGYTHGLYIGTANSLTVRQSFFHSTRIGHNLKSRAKSNRIENSYFMDGNSGTASYQVEFPNGGEVFLRGNLIQKGPNADNGVSVSFGAEGISTWPTNTMELRHNTLVSTLNGGVSLYAAPGIQSLTLVANLFAGNAGLLAGLATNSGVFTQQSSVTTAASNLPGATSINAPNFWPAAGVLGSLALAGVPDAQYLQDSPTPLTSRAINGSTRLVGALQAAP
ncbi:right-handed parallel beta-helix repeat-containing protein [Uliginosibacterium sp. H3]|uniref:Right-handed parallel beta-helix repeat-containing protein n=1 Tax=Uliginosibacterium silvisoli TaxID=3114758 RepID=A0ABU6K9B6_9RHOO|nr:right-handed parallel beta-helix repeat-containing protein [Uliginosibacterium sp. H3]